MFTPSTAVLGDHWGWNTARGVWKYGWEGVGYGKLERDRERKGRAKL